MIEPKFFKLILFFITGIAVIFAILQRFDIPSVFYIWEIAIDFKIVSIIGFLYFLNKKQIFVLNLAELKLFPMDWYRNLTFFLIPIFIYGIVVFLGLTSGKVTVAPLENKSTVILAALFDIPANCIFSVTIIFMEEIVFRFVLLKSSFVDHSKLKTLILVNIIWSIYSALSIIDFSGANFQSIVSIFISQFTIGSLLSSIVIKYKSIWYAYSLRIGMKIIVPLIVTSIVLDTDSFFTTNSLLFYAEGWISSVTMLLLAAYIYRKEIKMRNNPINLRKNTA